MARRRKSSKESGKVVLLSGGNPQIAKGDGDPPVQAYIASMPGWKRDLGKRLDALIVRTCRTCAKPEVELSVSAKKPGLVPSFHVYSTTSS